MDVPPLSGLNCTLKPRPPLLQMDLNRDRVLVNDLVIDQLTLSPSPWKSAAPQPALLTVTVFTDTSKAGATDNLIFSVSYADIAKKLRSGLSSENPKSSSSSSSSSVSIPPLNAYTLAEKAARIVLFQLDPPLPSLEDIVQIEAKLPDALLHGGILRATVKRTRSDYHYTSDTLQSVSSKVTIRSDSANIRLDSLRISDFTVSTILGLRDHERVKEQPLIIEVETWPNYEGSVPSDSMAWCAKTLQETVRRVS